MNSNKRCNRRFSLTRIQRIPILNRRISKFASKARSVHYSTKFKKIFSSQSGFVVTLMRNKTSRIIRPDVRGFGNFNFPIFFVRTAHSRYSHVSCSGATQLRGSIWSRELRNKSSNLNMDTRHRLNTILVPPFLGTKVRHTLMGSTGTSSSKRGFGTIFFFRKDDRKNSFPSNFRRKFHLNGLKTSVRLRPFRVGIQGFTNHRLVGEFGTFRIRTRFVFDLTNDGMFIHSHLCVKVSTRNRQDLSSRKNNGNIGNPRFHFKFRVRTVGTLNRNVASFLLNFSCTNVDTFKQVSPNFRSTRRFSTESSIRSHPITNRRIRSNSIKTNLGNMNRFHIGQYRDFPRTIGIIWGNLFTVGMREYTFLIHRFLGISIFAMRHTIFMDR